MMRAFVCIESEVETEGDIFKKLREIAGVKEVFIVYDGPYDIVAKVSAENKSELHSIVFDRIRKIDSIKTTVTLIVTGD